MPSWTQTQLRQNDRFFSLARQAIAIAPDELRFTTEAPTFEALVDRSAEIASELAEINGIVARGDELKVRILC
jgi:hypothetical protein